MILKLKLINSNKRYLKYKKIFLDFIQVNFINKTVLLFIEDHKFNFAKLLLQK